MSNLFLLGLPGSGKSTLGSQLAKHFGLHFIDLDVEIEKTAGQSIEQIFNKFGEPYFRKIEQNTLKEVVGDESGFVMAVGGGTPCYNDNMQLLNKSGQTIFLDVPTDVLCERLWNDVTLTRPLLLGLSADGLKEKIEGLSNERQKFYKEAKLRIQGSDISINDLLRVVK